MSIDFLLSVGFNERLMLAKKMTVYAIENFRRIVNTEQWVKKSSVPCRIWLKTKLNLATKKDVAMDSQLMSRFVY